MTDLTKMSDEELIYQHEHLCLKIIRAGSAIHNDKSMATKAEILRRLKAAKQPTYQEMGENIARTCFTNDPKKVEQFAAGFVRINEAIDRVSGVPSPIPNA
jgi:hypothetical protein